MLTEHCCRSLKTLIPFCFHVTRKRSLYLDAAQCLRRGEPQLPQSLNTRRCLDFISLSSFVNLAAIVPLLITLRFRHAFYWSPPDSCAASKNMHNDEKTGRVGFTHLITVSCHFLPSCILHLSRFFFFPDPSTRRSQKLSLPNRAEHQLAVC